MIWTILTGLNLLGSFIHTATSQMENFTTLRWPSRQDPWRFHLVQQKSTNSPYLMVLMGIRFLIPWGGADQRKLHILVTWFTASCFFAIWWWSVRELEILTQICYGFVFLEDTITSRAARNSGSMNDDLADLVISDHDVSCSSEPMGNTGMHVEPTGNECHES